MTIQNYIKFKRFYKNTTENIRIDNSILKNKLDPKIKC